MSVAYLFRAAKARTDGPCLFFWTIAMAMNCQCILRFRVRLEPTIEFHCQDNGISRIVPSPDAEICLSFVERTDIGGEVALEDGE